MSQNPFLPSLPTYERAAMNGVSDDIRAYFFGHAGGGTTADANLQDLGKIQITPRVLRDLRSGGAGSKILGRHYDHPIIVAPMASLPLLHPDGEMGAAAAATAQGCGMILSAQSAQPMQQVRHAGENCRWFQLYWKGDATIQLAQRAIDAGFDALVLTLDAPVNGVRDAEIETGFQLPPNIQSVNEIGIPEPSFEPLTAGQSPIFDRLAHILPRWDTMTEFCQNMPIPVVFKGILHPDDAENAIQAGASAIVVSNHGGRVFDGGPSAISALPSVAKQVAGRVPVFFDSGIRRGIDIVRAISLGADAVLVGRPVLHGLAHSGAQGASHVLRLLKDEMDIAMALSGCASIDDIRNLNPTV